MKFVSLAAIVTLLTRHIRALRPLIVGLNKYSHDASCCIMDSSTGKILFSQAKERISRIKHDGGAIGELLRYGLESIDASIDDIATVVSNNHHHRVLPFERRLPFYRVVNYTPEDYSDVMNILPNAQHLELSHHLAHAWSVVGQSEVSWSLLSTRMRFITTYGATAILNSIMLLHALCSRWIHKLGTSPFKEGLIVVMDGMGETYKAMLEDIGGVEVRASNIDIIFFCERQFAATSIHLKLYYEVQYWSRLHSTAYIMYG